MRTVLIVAVLAVCVGGCGDFHATGAAASQIDGAALVAQNNIPRATAVSISDSEATGIITATASTFAAFAAEKTTNPFSYFGAWLTGKPSILVNAEYATRLDNDSQLAAQTATTASGQPTAWLNAAVLKESVVILDIQNAKKGVSVSK